MEKNIEIKIQKIDELKKTLKTEFVGLSEIIDKVTEAITPWFLFRETFSLPYPICIWGPTGTGKTKMIKRICEILELKYDYMDTKDFLNKDENFTLKTYQPVKIWDEFHNAYTKHPNETVFFENKRKISSLSSYLSEGVAEIDILAENALFFQSYIKEICRAVNLKNEKQETPLNFKTINEMVSGSNISDEIKNIFKKENPLELTKFFADSSKWNRLLFKKDEVNKSNNLVFILGNLDPLFNSLIDNYSDSFKIKQKILSQTNQDIIESLNSLFFPEEISRLGTNHILFPVLTNDEYMEIINRKIKKTTEIFKNHDIELSYSSEFKEVIKETIVTSKYGVRTLDSSYRSMFEAPILSHLHKLVGKKVHVNFKEKNKITLNAEDKVYEIPFLSAKKKEISKDSLYQIAVHEAGHVLIHYLLTKERPEFVTANINSASLGGLAKFKSKEESLSNKEDLLNQIKRALGGLLAERLIFGENKMASGSFSDLKKATYLAETMVTKLGLGKNLSYIEVNSSFSKSLYSLSKEVDTEIKDILDESQRTLETLLLDNREKLLELAEVIQAKDKVYEKELETILN